MVDRVSNLPEDVLCHILSFLPAEQVFATRVLSKKGKPLWLLTPSLDFNQYRSKTLLLSSSSFNQFVYACILGRSIHQPIKTLRLKGRYSSNLHLNIWLNAAAERKLENLHVYIFCPLKIIFPKLPCSIFSIKTLVVLKLTAAIATFNAFSSIDLPSLKALHLDTVRFLDPQSFMLLLNGCPILVFPKLIHMGIILRSNNVQWNSVLDMLDHCPQLQSFVFVNTPFANRIWPNTHVPVPECFSSQLRTCVFKDFTGRKCEMRFIKFVMQNSTLLDTMTIFSMPDLCHKKKQKQSEMLEELASCPRSSATCDLFFM